MIEAKNAPAAGTTEGEATGLTGWLAKALFGSNDIAAVNCRPCVVACSLPPGSCQHRCPNLAVSR
jgi:hypothetical protein